MEGDDMENATLGDVLVAVGEEEPQALGVLGMVIARQRRDQEWALNTQIESLTRDLERVTRQRDEAWDRIDLIRHRQAFLMGDVDTLYPVVED